MCAQITSWGRKSGHVLLFTPLDLSLKMKKKGSVVSNSNENELLWGYFGALLWIYSLNNISPAELFLPFSVWNGLMLWKIYHWFMVSFDVRRLRPWHDQLSCIYEIRKISPKKLAAYLICEFYNFLQYFTKIIFSAIHLLFYSYNTSSFYA